MKNLKERINRWLDATPAKPETIIWYFVWIVLSFISASTAVYVFGDIQF